MKPMMSKPEASNYANAAVVVRKESLFIWTVNGSPAVEHPSGAFAKCQDAQGNTRFTPTCLLRSWGLPESIALSRMLLKFGFYGQYLESRIASLYRAGLHMPLEDDNDWILIENSVTGKPTATKVLTTLTPSLCWLDELKQINPAKAAEYGAST